MKSRERVGMIISGKGADSCGFWLGNPHPDSWPGIHKYFKTRSQEVLRKKLHDDFRWMPPPNCYKDPKNRPFFYRMNKRKVLGPHGICADIETLKDVENIHFPDPDYLDFTEMAEALKKAGDVYRAGGLWSPFFHEVCDLFGMENYFIKMYTHPQVVHAVTRRIVDFYLEGNRRLFRKAKKTLDGFFFGNDLGTQLDLLISPEAFREFVLPYFRELTDLAHDHGYQVILHACGAVYKAIPYLIDIGVDAIHPLQAKAANMDAGTLAREFKGKIAFLGGIDTQDLLIHATPKQVKTQVRRVKRLLGPNLIVSPSHEAILPDVPPENIRAMAEAAVE
jgi:uroporphyrinogen decarboxylase